MHVIAKYWGSSEQTFDPDAIAGFVRMDGHEKLSELYGAAGGFAPPRKKANQIPLWGSSFVAILGERTAIVNWLNKEDKKIQIVLDQGETSFKILFFKDFSPPFEGSPRTLVAVANPATPFLDDWGLEHMVDGSQLTPQQLAFALLGISNF